ncbi:MAG: hypothetical protein M3N14_12310 [Bacteroidota bacterium]|nr:hypothetical protein [Bacteroidota bacterium]
MSEEDGSRKSGKSGRPKGSSKSKVESPKSEAEKSNPDSYRDEHPQSEIETLQTANSKLPTENNMEVHHHPEVEKKDFKEYVLEGVMIFLAVTMGFFAESLRENINNDKKGYEFVKSLLVDLKADTGKMDKYFMLESVTISNYKSILGYLEKPLRHDTAYLSKFYAAAYSTMGRSRVYFTDRIISQLKNSDNFRLIDNDTVANAITDYSNGTIACDNQANIVDHFTEDCEQFSRQVINMKVYEGRFFDGQRARQIPDLISSDPQIAVQYSNTIYFKSGVEHYYMLLVKQQKQRAIKLIALLKKEYELE